MISNFGFEISGLKGARRAKARATLYVVLPLLLLLASLSITGGGTSAQRSDAGERLLEVGSVQSAAAAAVAGDEIKVVSYNIRWRGGEELRELIRLLRDDPEIGGADIILLQEVDRNKRRTKNTNTVKLMAEELKLHYAWAAPPSHDDEDNEEETGVALLSPHALTDVARLVLPHEGPNRRRRAAVGATVHVGKMPVRAYSIHAETRMPLEKKVEQWGAVLEDLARYPHVAQAVVAGDFNTIKGKDVRAARKLFADAGFTTPFADDRSTWRTFIIDLKLDWLWLRGFDHADHGIDKKIELSDHWPLWAKLKIEGGRKDAPGPAVRADAAGHSR